MSDLNIFKKGYHNWKCPIYNIRQFFRNCKYAWQRATKGYSDWDIWDLGTYYSDLISNSMTQFADETNSFTYGMSYDEWVNKIRSIANKIKASNDYEEKYWEELPVINNLDYNETKEWTDKHLKEEKEASRITAEGYKELGEIIEHLWW